MSYIYRYVSLEEGLRILKERDLNVTPLRYLNDPFEGVALPGQVKSHGLMSQAAHENGMGQRSLESQQSRERDRKLISCLSENFGVVSFSKRENSASLWGYYTKHAGVVLGFCSESLSGAFSDVDGVYGPCDVKYRSLDEVAGTIQYIGRGSDGVDDDERIASALLLKSRDWESEDEVRIYADLRKFKPDRSSCAYKVFSRMHLRSMFGGLDRAVTEPSCRLRESLGSRGGRGILLRRRVRLFLDPIRSRSSVWYRLKIPDGAIVFAAVGIRFDGNRKSEFVAALSSAAPGVELQEATKVWVHSKYRAVKI